MVRKTVTITNYHIQKKIVDILFMRFEDMD